MRPLIEGGRRCQVALVAVGLVLWGSCAAGDASEAEQDLDAVVAEILAGPDDTGYGEPERCILSGRIDRTQVLSDRLIVFHLRGGEKYVVQFKRRCPGLRRNGVTRIERRSMQICANDTIQGLHDVGFGGSWGARCVIPEFEPVTEEQIAFIEEALESR